VNVSFTEYRLLLSPVRLAAAIPRFSAIAVPWTPDTATGATVGAIGLTVTNSLEGTV
jgi:hypothetical protein